MTSSLGCGKVRPYVLVNLKEHKMDDELMMLSVYCRRVAVALGGQEREAVAANSCAAHSHGVVNMTMTTI